MINCRPSRVVIVSVQCGKVASDDLINERTWWCTWNTQRAYCVCLFCWCFDLKALTGNLLCSDTCSHFVHMSRSLSRSQQQHAMYEHSWIQTFVASLFVWRLSCSIRCGCSLVDFLQGRRNHSAFSLMLFVSLLAMTLCWLRRHNTTDRVSHYCQTGHWWCYLCSVFVIFMIVFDNRYFVLLAYCYHFMLLIKLFYSIVFVDIRVRVGIMYCLWIIVTTTCT